MGLLTISCGRDARVSFMLVLLLGIAPESVSADILWSWSFATEAGSFLTDGELAGDTAPPGTYTLLDFELMDSVDPNSLGSISGGQFDEGAQPGNGFVWDGSFDTQWFRDGGRYTNGSNIYHTSRDRRYLFFPSSYSLTAADGDVTLASGSVLSLTPLPEPDLALMVSTALAAIAGLAGRRRSVHRTDRAPAP